jgi:hypothetical protein
VFSEDEIVVDPVVFAPPETVVREVDLSKSDRPLIEDVIIPENWLWNSSSTGSEFNTILKLLDH